MEDSDKLVMQARQRHSMYELCSSTFPIELRGTTLMRAAFLAHYFACSCPVSVQDFREFFDAEEDEECRRQQPKAHSYLGSLKEEGRLKYVFDRTSHSRRGSLAAHLW